MPTAKSQLKRNSLIHMGIAAFLFILLATSVGVSPLQDGVPFRIAGELERNEAGMNMGNLGIWLWIFRGVLGLSAIILLLYIGFSLFTEEGRKRLLTDMVVLGILLLLAFGLRQLAGRHPMKPVDVPVSGVPNLDGWNTQQPGIEFTATPPDWFTAVLIVTTAGLLSAILIGVILWIKKRRHSRVTTERLAGQARDALQALRRGKSLGDVILRCYQDMTDLVRVEKGLTREQGMTTREFMEFLTNKGLPEHPLQTLTWLFEEVRYGGRKMGSREESMAVGCLTDIMHSCDVHEDGTYVPA